MAKQHEITVGKVYWQGGYNVKCSICGVLGRGTDKDKPKARAKAWAIGGKHRAKRTGGMWPGF